MSIKPSAPHPGAAHEPTGDPMKDGVGAASWEKDRADRPDLTVDGRPRIQPMSVLEGYHVDEKSGPNPMGMTVVAADGIAVGKVVDLWVDQAEPQLRYMTVALDAGGTALLPIGYARLHGREGIIKVQSIFSKHFADVPGTKAPDRITLREEDRLVGYYAGGYRYGEPMRNEPLF